MRFVMCNADEMAQINAHVGKVLEKAAALTTWKVHPVDGSAIGFEEGSVYTMGLDEGVALQLDMHALASMVKRGGK